MDVTVVTSTCRRPKALACCIEQVRRQVHSLRVEHIIVSDGFDVDARTLAEDAGLRYVETAPVGEYGAAAKDAGIAAALGEYVALWDDDNAYHPHALATLYAAAYGFDIGVCDVICRMPLPGLQDARMSRIPPALAGNFVYGEVDTMCVMLRTAVARTRPWHDGQGRGTDYRALSALVAAGATVRHVPIVIGRHL